MCFRLTHLRFIEAADDPLLAAEIMNQNNSLSERDRIHKAEPSTLFDQEQFTGNHSTQTWEEAEKKEKWEESCPANPVKGDLNEKEAERRQNALTRKVFLRR